MSNDLSFETIKDAAIHLLKDACNTANKAKEEYVVVGGWCPYLRNKSKYKHPGTLDVDLLFFGGNMQGQLGKIFQTFLENDYLISAKNDFQLLKKITIKDKPVVFNVDFLHPEETIVKNSIYVDHFDLGIRYDNSPDNIKKKKSIALPSSRFILEHRLYDEFQIEGGSKIPLINEAGLIFSKCKSIKSEKRYRDAFDIYLSLAQIDGNQYVLDAIKKSCLAEIGGREVRKIIEELKLFCTDNKTIFSNNVNRFTKEDHITDPSEFVASHLEQILKLTVPPT